LEDGDKERRGLAGACLGTRDDVAARERQRDDAALDRACFLPAEIADAAQQPFVE
jgi:hypothetical protein